MMVDERKGDLQEQEEGFRENKKREKKGSRMKKGKKENRGEELQHLRQRKQGEDERFGSVLKETHHRTESDRQRRKESGRSLI